MKKSIINILSVVGAALALSACELGIAASPTPNPISIMSTVSALQTLSALQTQAVLPANTTTATQVTPTVTPDIPPATSTPWPTATRSIPCNDVDFIKDLTYTDGTSVTPGQTFVKKWRIQNSGTCTWSTSYGLVFVSGNSMSGPAKVNLPNSVAPGQTIDLEVTLKAPSNSGTYTGYWMLQSANGSNFGYGPSSDTAWWVKIKVGASAYKSDAVPAPLGEYAIDFTALLCSASWTSSSGALTMPCAGYSSTQNAWVSVLMNPVFEGNNPDNERTIWMHPDESNGGWIRGIYPAYTIQDKDHYIAFVGCLDSSKTCDVTFKLEYKAGGTTTSLGSWHEVNDGTYTIVNLDLSALAGQSVEFVLTLSSNATTQEPDGFWFVPAIQNIP